MSKFSVWQKMLVKIKYLDSKINNFFLLMAKTKQAFNKLRSFCKCLFHPLLWSMHIHVAIMPQRNSCTHLKESHHQVSHAQVDHEYVHRRVVLPPPQKHPQHKAVPQGGKSQHHRKHCNLSPGQADIPHPGLGKGARCAIGAILGKDAKEGSPTVRRVEWVQFRNKRGREVVSSCGAQSGEA